MKETKELLTKITIPTIDLPRIDPNVPLVPLTENDKEYILEASKLMVRVPKDENVQNTIIFENGDRKATFVFTISTTMQVSTIEDNDQALLFTNILGNDELLLEAKEKYISLNFKMKTGFKHNLIPFDLGVEHLIPVQHKEENLLVFKDDRTKEEVFIFDYGFLKDASNVMGNQIQMDIRKQFAGIYSTKICLPKEWLAIEDLSYPLTLETTFKANDAIDDMVMVMTVNENGTTIPQKDGECLLGYTADQKYRVAVLVDTLKIVRRILQKKLDNYRIELNLSYKEGERYKNSAGFVVYCNDEVVVKSLMNDKDHMLKIDITSLIKKEVRKYQQNQNISTLQFTFFHDYDFLGSIEDTQFTGTDYVYIYNREASSSFQKPYVELKEGNQNEEVREYPMLEGGTTTISLNTKEVRHAISLGEIEEGDITLPIELQYRDNYRKKQETKSLSTHLGKGWYLNLEQRLEKEDKFDLKANGKKIVYYDGNQQEHEFVEKWYIKEGNNKKYISKNEVFFSMDGSLSYLDEEGKCHEVFYEAESEDGLTYLSKSSIYSYPQKNALKLKEHYYIRLSDGNLFEVYKTESGLLRIPVVISEEIPFEAKEEEKDSLASTINGLDAETYTKTCKNITMPRELRYSNGNFYKESDKVEVTYKEFPILLRDGKYSISQLDRIIKVEKNTTILFEHESYLEDEMEILYQPTYEFQAVAEEEYLNEDVMSIVDNMNECEEKLRTYKEKVKELSSALNSRKMMADYSQLQYMLSFNSTYQDSLIKLDGEDQYFSELIKSRVENQQSQYYQALQELLSYEQAIVQTEYTYQLLKEKKEALLKEEKDAVRDIILDKDGNALGFDKEGRLILVQNQKEEKLTLEYDGEDLLSISGEKEKVQFVYKKAHQLTQMIDTLGRVTDFQMEDGLLTKISFTKEHNELHSILFTYIEGDLLSIQDSANFVNEVEKHTNDVVITQSSTTSQIAKDAVSILTEPKVFLKEKIERGSSQAYCTITNMLTTQSVVYEFDSEERVIRTIVKTPTKEKEKEITTYHYESDHLRFVANYKDYQLLKTIENTSTNKSNQKEFTLSIGSETTKDLHISSLPTFGAYYFTFDLSTLENTILKVLKADLIIKVTDKDGNIREYQETMNGNVSSHMGIPFGLKDTDTSLQINLKFNQNIVLSTIQNIELYLADTTTYEYDEDDHLVKEVSGVEEVIYEEFHEEQPTLITKKDGYGNVSFIRYTLDNNKKVTHIVDENGNETHYLYDEEGRVIEERNYHSSAPLEARVKRYVYDENGYRQMTTEGRRVNQKEVYQETEIYSSTGLLRYMKSPRGTKTNYGYDFHTEELIQMGVDDQGTMNATTMSYHFGLLTSLEHHGMKITYMYDGKGRVVKRAIAGAFSVVTSYDEPSFSPDPIYPNKNRITSKVTTTSADLKVETTYDEDGKVIQVKNGDTETIYYAYNNDGTLREIIGAGDMISLDYFKKTEKVKSQIISTPTYTCSFEDSLDEKGRVKTHSVSMGSVSSLHTYAYNTKHQVTMDIGSYTGLKNGNSLERRELFVYDTLGRIKETRLTDGGKNVCNNQYKYLQNDDCTFDLITSHKVIIPNKGTVETQYTYDEENQISTIQKGNQKTRYQYDGLNRLIREDNEELNQTITYQYDEGGNLKFVRKYAYTLNEDLSNPLEEKKFTYSSKWKDQLVRVDNEVITYDTMGRMKKIGNDALTWNGKGQLTSYKDASFTYDVRNLRRTKGNLTYYYDGNGHILGEKGTKSINGVNQEIEIIYTYNMDKITGFVYNGVGYFYLRNIQGDILSIYKSEDSNLVASYQYDAWGNHTVTNYGEENIGNINPIRYRGYYYDEETGLYYLNSRYYDPRLRRFISPDTLSILDETMSEINGLNLYMYCKDNPVMYVDPSGCLPRWLWWVLGGLVVAGLFFATFAVAGSLLVFNAAITSAVCGIAYGSSTLTILSYAFVGSATVYGGALAYNALNIASAEIRGSTYQDAYEDFLDMGDDVFFATVLGGVTGAIGGAIAYDDQLRGLDHSWATERKHFFDKNPDVDKSYVLHHPYGRYGANIRYYVAISKEEHKMIHHILGYGRGQGGFYQYREWINWWKEILSRL